MQSPVPDTEKSTWEYAFLAEIDERQYVMSLGKQAKCSPFRDMERLYNPILQVYTDPVLESKARLYEAQRQQRVAVLGHSRAIRNEQIFETMKNSPKQLGDSAKTIARKPVTLSSSPSYNIVSNVEYQRTNPEVRSEQVSPYPTRFFALTRPYDIISGQYHRNNEQKVQAEFLHSKLEAVEKYWKTHKFDPILGQFVDTGQETSAKELEKRRIDVQAAQQEGQKPFTYQIHDVYHRHPVVGMTDTDAVFSAHRQRYELRHHIERELRLKNEQAEKKHLLGLGVASFERITGDHRSDTNPFKTEVNLSKNSGKVWEKLQTESRKHSKATSH